MIHITKHREGRKMEGIQSINTNSLTNRFCIASAKKDMICKSCYGNRQLKFYTSMVKPLQENNILLSNFKLKSEDIPAINANIFRFNAFGELINETHFRNLDMIALCNPDTMFALWTKQYKIVQRYYLTKGHKPNNLILIHSSYQVNKEEPLPEWFDKVFTVYDRWYASANEIIINCGRNCNDCRICYSKNTTSSVKEIRR